jgi:hypothetical protein
MALTAEERKLRASIAAHEKHSRNDPVESTAKARATFLERFQREADPDGVLDPAERARRADHLLKAHMARMSLAASKAKKARRKKVPT